MEGSNYRVLYIDENGDFLEIRDDNYYNLNEFQLLLYEYSSQYRLRKDLGLKTFDNKLLNE